MAYTYEYPRPALTVDIMLFTTGTDTTEILLIQRKHYPFEGCWALPGGFVDIDENIENAAHRELHEETSLTGLELKQFYTFGDVNRDPRGRTVSVVYYGFVDESKLNPVANDDASDTRWFAIKDLPKLAFDHEMIIKTAVQKLNIK